MYFKGTDRSVRLLQGRFWLTVIVSAVLVTSAIWPAGTHAEDALVVTISVGEHSRTIRTSASTVARILDRVDVELGDNDLVEPSLETMIEGPVYHINVYRARPVLIEDNGRSVVVNTPYSSPRLIAQDAGVTLYREDIAELRRVEDVVVSGIVGEKLIIDRATSISVNLYGRQFDYRTQAADVAGVLEEMGLVMEKADHLNLPVTTAISEGLNLAVMRIGTAVITADEVLTYGSDITWDPALPAGTRIIHSPGLDGRRLVTYEVVYHNEEEISRQELDSAVIEQPVDEQVTIGSAVEDFADNKLLGQVIAASRGYQGEQWQCLHDLWVRESQWNQFSENPTSGAYGIPQALPASKMATVADDWQTNPVTQITWGLNYIEGRYGTPCDAWSFFLGHNWY